VDTGAILAHLARIDEACDRILAWVFGRGTLAQFPRVVEYLAKENGGPGWEDTYQNHLVARLCGSEWFEKAGDSPDLFRCRTDSTLWRRDSFEWRMMACRERLICLSGNGLPTGVIALGAAAADQAFFSEDFARTVGFDPVGYRRIDLGDLVEYLTELDDGTCETLEERAGGRDKL
jgi:hypothetical protein